MTTYTRDFTAEYWCPRDIAVVYENKTAGAYPNYGISEVYGLYLEDTRTDAGFTVHWLLNYPHRKQNYNATVRFYIAVDDITKDLAFGIVLGSNNTGKKVYLAYYYNGSETLKIAVMEYGVGLSTLAETTETYTVSNNTYYKVKVEISYDEANNKITVNAYLLDDSDNVLLSLTNVEITDAEPIFGIRLFLGAGQTGRLYVHSLTIEYSGSPNMDYGLTFIHSPDMMEFDWVGAPSPVWFQHSDGKFYPYDEDGNIHVTVRMHGEASDVGDEIWMYKITGDPRDPSKWSYEKTLITRDQLGYNSVEESDLVVLNDGTYILFLGASDDTHGWCVRKLKSTDGGSSWTEEKIVVESAKKNALFVTKDGVFYLAYAPRPDGRPIYFIKSTDMGDSWTNVGSLTYGDTGGITAGLFYTGSKWIVIATIEYDSDDENYFWNKTGLFEGETLDNLTLVQDNLYKPQQPYTLWGTGLFYFKLLYYNNALYVIGETAVVDHNPDEGFTDQTERHTTITNDPVYTLSEPQFTIVTYTETVSGYPSETKTVTCTIKNVGDTAGDCEARLKDNNGVTVSSQTQTIDAGAEVEFSLDFTLPSEVGTYDYTLEAYNVTTDNVDDSKTVSVTVEEKPAPTPTPAGVDFNTLIALLIILMILKSLERKEKRKEHRARGYM